MVGRTGQIVVFQFPQSNNQTGKLRPALLLAPLPGLHRDWLVAMISSQTHQKIEGLDEIINLEDEDFAGSGLKTTSIVRVARLAVASETLFIGSIGEISSERLSRIKANLIHWIEESN